MPGFFDSISMFFIYGFMGWVIEVVYNGISDGKFINRGFLNGPICPMYGIGFYGVIIILTPFLNNFTMLFFGSMAITTLVELIAGIVLYKVFQLRWWDYSQFKFNLKGFICLRFSIYWGIACTLGLRVIQPAVLREWCVDWMRRVPRHEGMPNLLPRAMGHFAPRMFDF